MTDDLSPDGAAAPADETVAASQPDWLDDMPTATPVPAIVVQSGVVGEPPHDRAMAEGAAERRVTIGGLGGDPAALARLAALRVRRQGPPPTMGYQPALDGIRAVSVLIVILYHAGFSWMHGGFFGVEVFFVVSGFLITSLLLDEKENSGRIDLGQFWVRRARRLLPAFVALIAAVVLWAVFFGERHLHQLGIDVLPWRNGSPRVPPALYISNWAQIVGGVPYFAPTDPAVLRHLWSLAVEEQWYVVWPLAFWLLVRRGRGSTRVPVLLIVAALASMALAIVLSGGDGSKMSFLGWDTLRSNFVYLSTFTRASGLLLGAAFAFFWRPWRWERAAQLERVGLDVVGFVAMGAIVLVAATRSSTIISDGTSLWRIWMPLVTVLSTVAVAVSVHPGARRMRAVFGSRPLVEIGKRSYGLYLWHWPIFVFAEVHTDGHTNVPRFLVASAVTVAVSELCYRWVETPVRKGALGRMWGELAGGDRARRAILASFTGMSLVFLAVTAGVSMSRAEADDVAVDDAEVDYGFDPTTVDTAVPITEAPLTDTVPLVTITPTTQAALPRSVVVVGDSQAHSLAVNLPNGIEDTFTVTDGSVEGCGVLIDGEVRSERASFNRSFTDCSGFAQQWGDAAGSSGAEVALVVVGAWDVFDVEVDGTLVPFASTESDQRFLDGLQSGIDALLAAGSHVALLEVACMRPQDVEGAGVPALPERGDDTRVAHVNDLLRRAVTANPGGDVTFVSGPTEWCNDPVIAADLGYRWDGVHVYKPGANLIFTTIAPALLEIPL